MFSWLKTLLLRNDRQHEKRSDRFEPIPVPDGVGETPEMVLQSGGDGEQAEVPTRKPPRRKPRARARKRIPDVEPEREAIPSLASGEDLFALMGGDGEANEPEPACEEIFEVCNEGPGYPLWVEPEMTLDLHGLTREEAKRRIVSGLQTALAQRILVVEIITGKGLHSESGRAVLRETSEELLIGLKRAGDIRTWKWEGKTRGKSGAAWVRLPDPR